MMCVLGERNIMNHIRVSSSNLYSVGYDPASMRLQIAFRNGRLYEYENVPQNIYDGLMSAGSHGRYFDRFIRRQPMRYPYRRLR